MKSQALVLAALLTSISSTSQAHTLSTKHAAIQACEANQLRDACSYTHTNARYTGSCQSISEQLICVRQKPIEYLVDEDEVEHDH